MNGYKTVEERLVAIEIILKELKLQFTNHLAHHKRFEYILAGAITTLVVKMVFF